MPLRERLGPTIRKLRKAAGYSLDALAKRSGLTPSFVGAIERGSPNISLDTLEALARGLAVQPEVLIALIKTGGVPIREPAISGGYETHSGRRILGFLVLVARAPTGYIVSCPDLPDCNATSATRQGAVEVMTQLITARVELARRTRKTLPVPATSAIVIKIPI